MVALPRSGSCHSNDAEYDPLLVRIGGRIQVLVDGAPVEKVIAYNCNHGWVRALKVNCHGRPFIGDGKAVEQTLRGDVEVRWR